MLTLTVHRHRRSVFLTHNSCRVVAVSVMICLSLLNRLLWLALSISRLWWFGLCFSTSWGKWVAGGGGVVFHLQLTHCFFSFYPLLRLRFSSARILLWFHVVYFFCTVWGTRYHCLPQIWILKFGSEEQDCVRILSCRANVTTCCYVWLLHLLILLIIFM